MTQATFKSKDQNWQDGTTTYWFAMAGTDNGTGKQFDGERFGIVDEAGIFSVVAEDNIPVQNEYLSTIVLRECKITQKLLVL